MQAADLPFYSKFQRADANNDRWEIKGDFVIKGNAQSPFTNPNVTLPKKATTRFYKSIIVYFYSLTFVVPLHCSVGARKRSAAHPKYPSVQLGRQDKSTASLECIQSSNLDT